MVRRVADERGVEPRDGDQKGVTGVRLFHFHLVRFNRRSSPYRQNVSHVCGSQRMTACPLHACGIG